MKKAKNILIALTTVLLLTASCNNNKDTKTEKPTVEEKLAKISATTPQKLKGNFCFKKIEDKDVTDINFTILNNDNIKGDMIRNPFEKDKSTGTLTGKMISENEIKFIYDYMIEGEKQTEEIVMKLENGKLFIKEGELLDTEKNGNLTYKDVSKAVYSEAFDAIKCK